jgi:hypothetical protein
MRLKPLPLLQLKSQPKRIAFKQLRRIHRICGEHSRIFRDENAGLTTVRTIAAEICAGSEPCEIGGVLKQHGVSSSQPQKFTDAGMLVLDVRQTVNILHQTSLRLIGMFTARHSQPPRCPVEVRLTVSNSLLGKYAVNVVGVMKKNPERHELR